MKTVPIKLILICAGVLVLSLLFPCTVSAEKAEAGKKVETEKETGVEQAGALDQVLDLENEYDSIQDVMDSLSGGTSFSFRSYVAALAQGEVSFSLREIGQHFLDGIRAEFTQGRKNISLLLAVGVVGGMLSSLAGIFLSRQAADTGFYMLYLLLFSALSVTFMELAALAEQVFAILLQFMKVLLPAYFLAIAFCTGARTSYVFYETMLVMITVVEVFIMNLVLPAIKVYFVLGMVHHITEKPFLTKFLSLLEAVIRGSIKTVFLVMLSIQGIEGMLAPFADSAAKSVVLKAVGAIPGLGTGAVGLAEALLKSGMLLKNAIGTAGVLGIIFLCAYPISKMLFYTGLYHLAGAVTEAVAETRLLSCMECSAHAAGLLLYTACAGILLFLLTIGITLAATNL